jgi:hypothetical protein
LWSLLTHSTGFRSGRKVQFDGSEGEEPQVQDGDKMEDDNEEEEENVVDGIVRYSGGITR